MNHSCSLAVLLVSEVLLSYSFLLISCDVNWLQELYISSSNDFVSQISEDSPRFMHRGVLIGSKSARYEIHGGSELA